MEVDVADVDVVGVVALLVGADAGWVEVGAAVAVGSTAESPPPSQPAATPIAATAAKSAIERLIKGSLLQLTHTYNATTDLTHATRP